MGEEHFEWDKYFEMKILDPDQNGKQSDTLDTTLVGKTNCFPCGKDFTSVLGIKMHVQKNHPRMCWLCAEKLTISYRYGSHKSMGPRRYEVYMNGHTKHTHGIDLFFRQIWLVNDGVRNFPCPLCLKTMDTSENFYDHVRSEHSNRCPLCFSSMKSQDTVKAHIVRSHRESYLKVTHKDQLYWHCSLCDSQFYAKNRLVNHYSSCHPDEAEDQSALKDDTSDPQTPGADPHISYCQGCSGCTDSNKPLFGEGEQSRETTEPDEKRVNGEQERRRSSRRIKRPSKFEPEMSVVVKRLKKTENRYGRSLPQHLSRNQYLPETTIMNSRNIQRSICAICPKAFEDFSALDHHQKSVHLKQCVFCQSAKFYNYEKGVKAHLSIYHQVREGKLSEYKGFEFCSLCTVSFNDFKTLRSHAAELHPYHCPECWVEFETRCGPAVGASMVNAHYREIHQKPVFSKCLDQKMCEAAQKITKLRQENKLPTNPLELNRTVATNQTKVAKSELGNQAGVAKSELSSQTEVDVPKQEIHSDSDGSSDIEQYEIPIMSRMFVGAEQKGLNKKEKKSPDENVTEDQKKLEEYEMSDHIFEIAEGVKKEIETDEPGFVENEYDYEEVIVKKEMVDDGF